MSRKILYSLTIAIMLLCSSIVFATNNSSMTDKAARNISGAGNAALNTAGNVVNDVGRGVGGVINSAGNAVNSVGKAVSDIGSDVGNGINETTDSLTNTSPAGSTSPRSYNATRTSADTAANENAAWTWFFIIFAAAAIIGLIAFYSSMGDKSKKDRY